MISCAQLVRLAASACADAEGGLGSMDVCGQWAAGVVMHLRGCVVLRDIYRINVLLCLVLCGKGD